jgi:hypothetical protein
MKTPCSEFCILLFLFQSVSHGQNLVQPSPDIIPYGRTALADVKQVMDRVLAYVDKATPVGIINRVTGETIVDLTKPLKGATPSAGASMAFDPAFYYQRPLGTGPHGYGSVLLAGAAMYKLLKEHPYEGNGPVIFKRSGVEEERHHPVYFIDVYRID